MEAREGRALLKRYEQILEDSPDPRLPVLWALLEADRPRFNKALTVMMEEREVRYRKLAEQEVLDESVLATEGYLSVEGLALARLAESSGLQPLEDYLFIPSVARESTPRMFRPDSRKRVGL
jgi:immunity protein 49 of polymorphic toxin system